MTFVPMICVIDLLFNDRLKDNQNESFSLVLLRQELQDVFLSTHGLLTLSKVGKQLAFAISTQERNEQDRLLGGQPRQAAPGSHVL